MQRRVLLCVVVIAMLAVFAGGLIACKQEKQTDFVVTSVEGVHDYDIDAEKMIISVADDISDALKMLGVIPASGYTDAQYAQAAAATQILDDAFANVIPDIGFFE